LHFFSGEFCSECIYRTSSVSSDARRSVSLASPSLFLTFSFATFSVFFGCLRAGVTAVLGKNKKPSALLSICTSPQLQMPTDHLYFSFHFYSLSSWSTTDQVTHETRQGCERL
jgi:hypothetical protein